ncbi:NPCBM/NEW2 domain-containing protein [Lysinibacillus xylanilyticus]|uniref:NPCBM/NEW2 domain-containing protein n=1 Tax=Lysinibacillus xylanilyticus TaxID=582475 RepID=A0ABT4EUJ0_9BACI|nr:NPCBM/NEW2 domain-containing protein [Lysinibacillus xylanilyticus]MCY9549339.1 NPCBM/NEW2 domain-containing protein [Lysinibacillus xylanilyticus]MED3803547.1 NPCBM/NEW2 domain-containing protein [Lysinibacillus xylanilyticus]
MKNTKHVIDLKGFRFNVLSLAVVLMLTICTFFVSGITTTLAAPVSVYLSDELTPTSVTGDIEQMTPDYFSYNKNQSFYKTQLSIKGVKYEKGIGSHSNSSIKYNLNGQYTKFTVDVGIDDQVAPGHGSVNFVIIADGKILYISPVKKSNEPAEHVEVDIAGKNTLELVAFNANDNIDNDHADWADAKLFK